MVTKADIPAYGDYDAGERIELPHGFYAVVRVHHDSDHEAPWDDGDGHGDVSEWTTRDKRAGERVLHSDRHSKRFYAYAGAIAKAKREGWDAPPYTGTKGERAARAVERDYEWMRAWCNDQWRYISVAVELFDRADTRAADDSLWDIESEGDYWRETAAEMIEHMLDIETGRRRSEWRAALREAREQRYWNARDVVTR